jgi:hypothetical protein
MLKDMITLGQTVSVASSGVCVRYATRLFAKTQMQMQNTLQIDNTT